MCWGVSGADPQRSLEATVHGAETGRLLGSRGGGSRAGLGGAIASQEVLSCQF